MRNLRRTIRRFLPAAGLGLVAPLLFAGAASAAAPEQRWIDIENTFGWDDCGFPVVQHDSGQLHFIEWLDDSGNFERRLVLAPGARSTFTNQLTGESVTSGNPFVVHRTDNPDGSVTVALTGLRFAIRGGGVTYVSSGRELIVFTQSGMTVLSSAGPRADLCEALQAAIG
jgi:hypothetical protein